MAIIKKNKLSFKEKVKLWPVTARENLRLKITLLCVSVFFIFLDQLSKILVVHFIPEGGSGFGKIYEGFFSVCHVRNRAIAFSIGRNLPDHFKFLLFVVLTVIAMAGLVLYYFVGRDLKKYNYYAFMFIFGGIGNILDRIFRFSNGVVDWLDFKWFNLTQFDNVFLLKLLSFKRWPTFNFADSCVVVGACILIVGMIVEDVMKRKAKKLSK